MRPIDHSLFKVAATTALSGIDYASFSAGASTSRAIAPRFALLERSLWTTPGVSPIRCAVVVSEVNPHL
jgi:hypothetical protein